MQRALRQRQGQTEQHTRQSEATSQALLDAAETIFARDGFSGARVEEIAQLAGHNKALIFHYFTDKLGLYRAMMGRTKERIGAQFQAVLARFEDTQGEIQQEQLRALITELAGIVVTFYTQNPNSAHILIWEAAEGWQTFLACVSPKSDAFSARLLAWVKQAQTQNIIRADVDVRMLVTTFMSLPLIYVVSVPRFQHMFPGLDFASPAAQESAQQQMSDILLNGILTSNHHES